MASCYKTASIPLDDVDLIPIYYRVPFVSGYEIISGYLEKKILPKGSKQKRFYGHYQCEDCSNRWKSGNAWQGYTQDCKSCSKTNWPFKVYHLEQSVDPLDGKPHKSELCGKCQELGYNCRTGTELPHNWKLCAMCQSLGYNCKTGAELPHNWKLCAMCQSLGYNCKTGAELPHNWKLCAMCQSLGYNCKTGAELPHNWKLCAMCQSLGYNCRTGAELPHNWKLCAMCQSLGYNCKTGAELPHNWKLCAMCQSLGYDCKTGAELPHDSKSCEKCITLGHYCQTDNTAKSSPTKKFTSPSKYDVCFNKQFELLSYDIMIEPKFIRDLYKALWPHLSQAEEMDFIQGLSNARREWKIKVNHDLVEACEDILDEISN